jgi:hypothetical protein
MLEQYDVQLMLDEVRRQLRIMTEYCELRHELQDWHGIMDASADIRELKAKEQVLLEVLGQEGK